MRRDTMSGSRMSIVLLLLSLGLSRAIPTFLIDAPKSHCVELVSPRDEVIEIAYTAPDLPPADDPKRPPVYISVSMKPSKRVFDLKHHESPVATRLKPTTQRLEQEKGVIRHRVEVDGTANICIRASGASSIEPMRFSLQLSKKTGEEASLLTKKEADDHLSNMATELERIEQAIEKILREADFAKDNDEVFHSQTEAMHKAAMFWPIVQVCVLIMTGFTQASHIVRFFKSRRII